MSKSTQRIRLATTVAVLFAAQASARSIVVQPRVSTGVQDYQLNFDNVIVPIASGGTDSRGGFKVQDHIAFVGAGLNLSSGRLFSDLSGQWSEDGHDHNDQIEGNAIGDGIFTSGDGQNHSSDTRFHGRNSM